MYKLEDINSWNTTNRTSFAFALDKPGLNIGGASGQGSAGSGDPRGAGRRPTTIEPIN
jgi:hypothetical protein